MLILKVNSKLNAVFFSNKLMNIPIPVYNYYEEPLSLHLKRSLKG